MNKRGKYCIGFAMLTAILISYPSFSLCSQSKSDSLKALLNQADHDTIRIRMLFEMGNLYIDGPSDSLVFYYKEALNLIDKFFAQPEDFIAKKGSKTIERYKRLNFRALLEIGIEKFFQGKYNESLENYFKALKIAQDINDIGLVSEVNGAIGIVYKNQGEYAQALEFYEQALSAAIELNDTSWIAACYANAGNVYRRLTNYSKALDYFLKALEVFEKEGESRRMAISYMNIGNLYEDQKDYNTALEYYSRALQLSYQTDDKKRIAECLANIGNIYSAQKAFNTARDFYRQSLEINIELGYEHTVDDCYKYIGSTYELEGLTDTALVNYRKAYEIALKENDKLILAEVLGSIANIFLMKKSYREAMENADKSLQIGLETGDPQNIKNAYLYLSEAWQGLNNPIKALEYFKLYSNIKDTIFSSDKYKAIKDLEMKYETEKKEQKLALLTEKNQVQVLKLSRRYRLLWGIGILAVLIMLIIYLLFRQKELRSKHMAVELEQKLLRSQMNPHFIFNSLIAIQSFIYKKDPVQAGDYLAKFAELIRITLENSRSEFVLLEREIKMLEIYLELQCLRFDNKFNYQLEIDENIDASTMRIPPMLAQPFIENAIEHGLRYKDTKGNIKINYMKSNGILRLIVEDDGIGREKAAANSRNKKHASMATSITIERLEVLSKRFKQKLKLELTDLKNEEGMPCGTQVKFSMPYKISV
ncbi:MAG: tetratricopeptide repeat protein [Bacteroidales bacterium]|nr:tetratricopeptide repeat protein [Bacteroidales bacterium]